MDFLAVFISVSVITVLIVVHEFGHYLAAKFFGFQTPIFGIGLPFGPHIDLFKKWDTQFRFHWLLIGGFVAIPELGDETNSEELNKEFKLGVFREFPVWQRAIVASGGIVFNILFALIVAIIMANTIGLPQATASNTVTDFISKTSVARKLGLEKGDTIIAVNDAKITNGEELKNQIQSSAGKNIVLTINRQSSASDAKIIKYELKSEGSLGIVLGHNKTYKKSNNFINGILEAVRFTTNTLIVMFVSVFGIFETLFHKILSTIGINPGTDSVDLGQVKGIVGIVQIISEDIRANAAMLFEFSILLSLNLAVINLLPIPALDGGHLVFMGYEAIAGKKACEKFQENAVKIGFVFLLSLMAITTINDIKNWIFH